MRSTRPRRPSSHRTLAAAALVASLALTGTALTACTPGDGGPAAGPTGTDARTPTAVTLPDTAAGEHARWLLASMNDESPTLGDDIAERMSPAFLDQLPADQLVAVLDELRAAAPWIPTAVQGDDSLTIVTVASDSAAGDALDMQLSLDEAGLISGLLFSPSAAARTPSTSWDGIASTVGTFAADTVITVTEVEQGEPGDRLLETGDGSAKPSGSIFKLYVLGAVADAVAAGTLAWDTPLTITDDLKSLPSGELQDLPAGSIVTVREAAEKMIAISDNTAADLLIDAVGPAAVEQAFADMGQQDPTANVPLLTTRGLFQLGWGDDATAREAWSTGDAQGKQTAIDALPTGLVQVPVTDIADPVWSDGIDWYFTPDDLVAAHLALQEKAATASGAPVRDILAINDGLGDVFGDEWSYVAFKGGSSMGVLAGSWYLERTDGATFVVSIQGSSDDPAALADTATFFGQVADAVALLAKA